MKKPFTLADSADGRRFVQRIRAELIPKMADSAVITMIAPDIGAEFDVDFAVQIGAAVLLEKPLLVLLPEGRTPPPKLARIADRIITVDLDSARGQQNVETELKKFFTDFARQ